MPCNAPMSKVWFVGRGNIFYETNWYSWGINQTSFQAYKLLFLGYSCSLTVAVCLIPFQNNCLRLSYVLILQWDLGVLHREWDEPSLPGVRVVSIKSYMEFHIPFFKPYKLTQLRTPINTYALTNCSELLCLKTGKAGWKQCSIRWQKSWR